MKRLTMTTLLGLSLLAGSVARADPVVWERERALGNAQLGSRLYVRSYMRSYNAFGLEGRVRMLMEGETTLLGQRYETFRLTAADTRWLGSSFHGATLRIAEDDVALSIDNRYLGPRLSAVMTIRKTHQVVDVPDVPSDRDPELDLTAELVVAVSPSLTFAFSWRDDTASIIGGVDASARGTLLQADSGCCYRYRSGLASPPLVDLYSAYFSLYATARPDHAGGYHALHDRGAQLRWVLQARGPWRLLRSYLSTDFLREGQWEYRYDARLDRYARRIYTRTMVDATRLAS